MIQPNTEKSVTANTREALCHMVGQTIVPKVVADQIGEKPSNVSAAMYQLVAEKRLRLEKKVGNTNVYLVLPSIANPRPADNRPRMNKRTKKHNGTDILIEKNIPLPSTASKKKAKVEFPFADMKPKDSFRFPAKTKNDLTHVRRCAGQYIKNKNNKAEFFVARVGKVSGRCWRIK